MAASRIDTFKQILESDPENTTVLFGLANEYLKAERYAEAIVMLRDYLTRADDEARAAYERGIEAATAHNHPSMAADYRMTLETDYDED
jgi:cytochrome c-type biogenesis protein CcmH/NrfG